MLQKVEVYTYLGYKVYTFGVADSSDSVYSATKIEGLTPVKGDFNLFELPNHDGAYMNSSRVGVRNIVITVHFGSLPGRVEEFRRELYKLLAPNMPVTLKFVYGSDSVNRKIDAYLEVFDSEIFSNKPTMDLNFICPDPYFRNTLSHKETLTTGTYSEDRYALGSAESGFGLTVYGNLSAEYYSIWNNIDDPLVIRVRTGGGTKLSISTQPGNKYVRLYAADGTYSNALQYIESGSLSMKLGGYRNYLSVRCQDLDIPLRYDLNMLPKWVGL